MIMNMIIRLSTSLVLGRCCLALLCAWRDTAALGWYRWHTLVPVSPPLVLVGETLWHILQACPNWGWWCHNCRVWSALHFVSKTSLKPCFWRTVVLYVHIKKPNCVLSSSLSIFFFISFSLDTIHKHRSIGAILPSRTSWRDRNVTSNFIPPGLFPFKNLFFAKV